MGSTGQTWNNWAIHIVIEFPQNPPQPDLHKGLPRKCHTLGFCSWTHHSAAQVAELMPNTSWQFKARWCLVTAQGQCPRWREHSFYDSTCSGDRYFCWVSAKVGPCLLLRSDWQLASVVQIWTTDLVRKGSGCKMIPGVFAGPIVHDVTQFLTQDSCCTIATK